jgi:cyclopropane-fatty-acyl-phospholipid synthase
VLDLGCGWGAMLAFFQRNGQHGVGRTLSRGQQRACLRHGLEVHLHDARTVTRETYGPFNGVVSLGAFEHFCSIDEYREGKQDHRYQLSFFENVATVIPPGGKFFLQTRSSAGT